MFKRHKITLMSNPNCLLPVKDLDVHDFCYYDKDGFELNVAEQKFYRAMGHPIEHPILNHVCWQEPWFELEKNIKGLILDHSMFLCRCSYLGHAREQLEKLKETVPQADLLLRTKIKWGYDFALDGVRENQTFEVLHIEFDSQDYNNFLDSMIKIDWTIRHTDWQDAADRVWNCRKEWEGLKGFEQNHWKAKYLINWSKAEFTEKAV